MVSPETVASRDSDEMNSGWEAFEEAAERFGTVTRRGKYKC